MRVCSPGRQTILKQVSIHEMHVRRRKAEANGTGQQEEMPL